PPSPVMACTPDCRTPTTWRTCSPTSSRDVARRGSWTATSGSAGPWRSPSSAPRTAPSGSSPGPAGAPPSCGAAPGTCSRSSRPGSWPPDSAPTRAGCWASTGSATTPSTPGSRRRGGRAIAPSADACGRRRRTATHCGRWTGSCTPTAPTRRAPQCPTGSTARSPSRRTRPGSCATTASTWCGRTGSSRPRSRCTPERRPSPTSTRRSRPTPWCAEPCGGGSGLTLVEVATHVLRHRRDVVGDAVVADRLRPEHTGGHGLARSDRGDVGDAAVAHEAQELGDQARIRSPVPALGARDDVDRVGAAGPGTAGLPDVDLRSAAIAHVLDPPRVTDHGVVAEIVGREVALLVGGEHAVVEPHLDHRDVLDVDDRVQLLLGRGRPGVRVEPVPHE